MQISKLKNILEKIENCPNESTEKVIGPMDLTESFIENLIRNSHINPSGRRYSQMVYDLSYVLHIHSNITYTILRTFLPLPSEQMWKKKFGPSFIEEKNNLLDSNQIQVILNEFKDELSADEEIYATIAYDSATVDNIDKNILQN